MLLVKPLTFSAKSATILIQTIRSLITINSKRRYFHEARYRHRRHRRHQRRRQHRYYPWHVQARLHQLRRRHAPRLRRQRHTQARLQCHQGRTEPQK